MISLSIGDIRSRINDAALKKGCNPEDIILLAATKKVSSELIREAINNGISHFGENKVQEAILKIDSIGRSVSWHMIGHLQTNKAKKAVEAFDVIQSLDSFHLAESLDKYAKQLGKKQVCLVEINIGGEESKFGVNPEELIEFLNRCNTLQSIEIQGLMTITPYFEDKEKARPYFKKMNELFQKCGNKLVHANVKMKFLSMGMSGDFEAAIEEGSNMVRIGTAIFGERN
ncbi:MAG: YggS family pyridoxal phosphate-dependent enzyme [bacterium]